MAISLNYDPALLGDVNIQDVAATANQGLFEQPTPAHIWIGFVPEGIQRDAANHWGLSREPQVIVFNLNDFGSFALADEMAREWIAEFLQLLVERPSTLDREVPILPLVNAAQTVQAQVQWLEFGNGAGVRFVTSYSQDTVPVTNDQLRYIFYGMTNDGLHGVTAVFPLTAAGLPDIMPDMSDSDYANFGENYEVEMVTATEQLNNTPDNDFRPLLSQLDALVKSISIMPTGSDYPVTDVEPQNGQVIVATDIFAAPTGEKIIGNLKAGEAVVVNGLSSDGSHRRILCDGGTTGNCWVAAEALEVSAVVKPVLASYGGLLEGQVVQIEAVTDNSIYRAPSDIATVIGTLLAGEAVEVYAPDESGMWLNIACPRGIGVACWVVADPAINAPTGFFSSDSSLNPGAVVTSPDGLWRATLTTSEILQAEEGEEEQFPEGKYRVQLAVVHTESGPSWMAVDEWRAAGLGLTYPELVRWSSDGRFFYFANVPMPDGCITFVNGGDLWRLDLESGQVIEVAPYLGLVMALSPGEKLLAVNASYGRGFLIRDLASGQERPTTMPRLSDDWRIGALQWSPDGRHLLMTQQIGPCGQEIETAIVLVDAEALTASTLLEPDGRKFMLVDWLENGIVELLDASGNSWLLETSNGQLSRSD